MVIEILELYSIDMEPGMMTIFRMPTWTEWNFTKEHSVVVICHDTISKEKVMKSFPELAGNRNVHWIYMPRPIYKLADHGWEAYTDMFSASYVMWPADGSSIISAKEYEYNDGKFREVPSRRVKKSANKEEIKKAPATPQKGEAFGNALGVIAYVTAILIVLYLIFMFFKSCHG